LIIRGISKPTTKKKPIFKGLRRVRIALRRLKKRHKSVNALPIISIGSIEEEKNRGLADKISQRLDL